MINIVDVLQLRAKQRTAVSNRERERERKERRTHKTESICSNDTYKKQQQQQQINKQTHARAQFVADLEQTHEWRRRERKVRRRRRGETRHDVA